MADQEKIEMGKVFIEGQLLAKTPYPKFPLAHYHWHVAPVAYVKQENSRTELLVFDPSLFNHPVTVDTWKAKHLENNPDYPKSRVDSVYFGSKYQYYARTIEWYKDTYKPYDLQVMKEQFERWGPEQDSERNADISKGLGSGKAVR